MHVQDHVIFTISTSFFQNLFLSKICPPDQLQLLGNKSKLTIIRSDRKSITSAMWPQQSK